MGKDITREELLNELCLAFQDMKPVQDDEFPVKIVARSMGIHPATLFRRIENGQIPEGWEAVERRGNNGQKTKCLRKIDPIK
jgi:hypothetical protein